MPIREINGFRMHYQHDGRGPDLVYVHGGFASLGRALSATATVAAWQRDLAERFRLLCYDRRACGRSSCPPGGFDIPTQAEDLAVLLDRLDVESTHVFASSAGGPIALRFAARHRDRVRSLVLAGTAPSIVRPGDGVRERILAANDELTAHGAEVAFDRRPADAQIWFTSRWDRSEAEAAGELDRHLATERELRARADRQSRAVRVRYHAAEVRNIHAYTTWTVHEDAAAVAAPTLVLHGGRDTVFGPSAGRAVAELVPAARFELVAEAGHTPVFTDRAARRLAADFMAGAEARFTADRWEGGRHAS
ncbi:MAG: alpha/beta fold hydrolase [Kutzneria sp.]|nr:alpha/beta fold hydrolase [Kutzneria sp.]MBV9845611.1 alpha/beta fold hydrolase [Kutzneria sp.]